MIKITWCFILADNIGPSMSMAKYIREVACLPGTKVIFSYLPQAKLHTKRVNPNHYGAKYSNMCFKINGTCTCMILPLNALVRIQQINFKSRYLFSCTWEATKKSFTNGQAIESGVGGGQALGEKRDFFKTYFYFDPNH